MIQFPVTYIPTFYEEEFRNPWQMSTWEKHALINVVNALKPEVALEIGNADGGSLQVLCKSVPKVYAIDIDNSKHHQLKSQFPSVDFRTGSSTQLLKPLLGELMSSNEKLGLVLIDGDHSLEGVKLDINTILLNYVPVCELVIVMHDSFNPECRKGILSADWKNCEYVHFVEIDYLPGAYVDYPYLGKMQRKTMWGGFAIAILSPVKRNVNLKIGQNLKEVYDQLYKGSLYNTYKGRLRDLIKKLTSN